MVEGCDICQLLAVRNEVIFQTEYWRVTLAPDQAYLGRAYVTLLEHRSSLAELNLLQLMDWHRVVVRYEGMVWLEFGAAVFNWSCLMNNAFQVDNPQPHVHWHVRPRYAQIPSVNGAEFPDASFGHHYDRQRTRLVSPRMLASIGERLRSRLLGSRDALLGPLRLRRGPIKLEAKNEVALLDGGESVLGGFGDEGLVLPRVGFGKEVAAGH